MPRVKQDLDTILKSLQSLAIPEWQDDVAFRVIDKLAKFPVKEQYQREDLQEILQNAITQTRLLKQLNRERRRNGEPPSKESPFDEILLILRLFLGLSSDPFKAELTKQLGPGGINIERYISNREAYLDALVSLKVLEAISTEVNRQLTWTDILVERLRAGRGRAVSGIKRGTLVESKAEEIVKTVFPGRYQLRCDFLCKDNKTAKCDIAIPNARDAHIVIESKGFEATGSKQTDVIGDVERIIKDKRNDTTFLLFTDGVSWRCALMI